MRGTSTTARARARTVSPSLARNIGPTGIADLDGSLERDRRACARDEFATVARRVVARELDGRASARQRELLRRGEGGGIGRGPRSRSGHERLPDVGEAEGSHERDGRHARDHDRDRAAL